MDPDRLETDGEDVLLGMVGLFVVLDVAQVQYLQTLVDNDGVLDVALLVCVDVYLLLVDSRVHRKHARLHRRIVHGRRVRVVLAGQVLEVRAQELDPLLQPLRPHPAGVESVLLRVLDILQKRQPLFRHCLQQPSVVEAHVPLLREFDLFGCLLLLQQHYQLLHMLFEQFGFLGQHALPHHVEQQYPLLDHICIHYRHLEFVLVICLEAQIRHLQLLQQQLLRLQHLELALLRLQFPLLQCLLVLLDKFLTLHQQVVDHLLELLVRLHQTLARQLQHLVPERTEVRLVHVLHEHRHSEIANRVHNGLFLFGTEPSGFARLGDAFEVELSLDAADELHQFLETPRDVLGQGEHALLGLVLVEFVETQLGVFPHHLVVAVAPLVRAQDQVDVMASAPPGTRPHAHQLVIGYEVEQVVSVLVLFVHSGVLFAGIQCQVLLPLLFVRLEYSVDHEQQVDSLRPLTRPYYQQLAAPHVQIGSYHHFELLLRGLNQVRQELFDFLGFQ